MLHRLNRAISLGFGLAGCSARAVDGGSDGGDGDGAGEETSASATASTATASSASATVSSSTSTPGESSAGDVDDGSDDTPYFDLPPQPDVGGPQPPDCDNPELPAQLQGLACERDEQFGGWVAICQPAPPDGICSAIGEAEREALEVCAADFLSECGGFYDQCGPTPLENGACCYWGTLGQLCPGRPFVVAGQARLAPLCEGDAWCDATLCASIEPEASPAFAELLAAAWLFDAQHEHAAIASFSRFALQLLAMAAPPRFVDGALRAALDEREHAGLFFALARTHGRSAWAPGPLSVTGALVGADDPIHVVVATIREGCVAETISALQLQAARDAAEDPALRNALSRVLEQELAHVDLAWTFVAWALSRGDAALRAAVAAAFSDPARWIPSGPAAEPAATEADRWRRHGRLTAGDRHAIATRAIDSVILPAAQRMLGHAPRRAAAQLHATPLAAPGVPNSPITLPSTSGVFE
jgi:hypothetical protein